jgi:hypothetical protein
MLRFFYTIAMVALVGGTAWAATELRAERPKGRPGGVGFVILTALQR